MKINFIKNQTDLEPLIELVREIKIVAIDTEFDREKSYFPILSLIQIAVKKNAEMRYFIIDAVELKDLSEFVKIIFDEKIKKIFHSSIQDLQIFCKSIYQPNEKEINNLTASLIDTQIMANLSGVGFNVGYGFLVENFFNQKIDKSLQRSSWLDRPLSEKHINYAILDVVYLHQIFEKLTEILIDKQRFDWYQQEVELFVKSIFSDEKKNFFRNFNLNKMTEKQFFLLKNLVNWREEKAREINIPRQHFLKDKFIQEVAITAKINDSIKNLDDKKISEIRKIIEIKNENDGEKLKNFCYKFSKKDKEKIKNIEEIISEIAKQNQMAKQFLMSKEMIKNFLIFNNHEEKNTKQNPQNSAKYPTKYLTNWRYQILDSEINRLIIQ